MTTIHDIERRFPDVWLSRAIKHLDDGRAAGVVAAKKLLEDCKRQVPRLDIGAALRQRGSR